MKPSELSLSQIYVGQTATHTRTWTEEDVRTFASLSGDENPLHLDIEYAKTTPFGERLVHGMLVGSLCSTLVGMYLPGKKCLYLSQSLIFKKPVFIGDTTTITGVVTAMSEATHIITLAVTIRKGLEKDSEIVLLGESKAQVL
jgi:acyl dehydratase